MCQASLKIEVVRLLKGITFLLNEKVDYYTQNSISWLTAIVGIYGIAFHHALGNSNVWR